MKLNQLTMRQRMLGANGITVFLMMIAVLLILFRIFAATESIETQQRSMAKAQQIIEIQKTFHTMKYWSLAYSISFQDQAEAKIDDAYYELQSSLQSAKDILSIDDVKLYHQTMSEAVAAYTDDHRLLGSQLNARAEEQAMVIERKLNEQVEEIQHKVNQDSELLISTNQMILWTLVSAGVLVFIVMFGFTLWLVRSFLNQLGGEPNELRTIADAIAQDQLDVEIDEQRKLIGVYAAMVTMKQNLLDRVLAERTQAAEVNRIKQALDDAFANVMIADTNHQIIYVNNTALSLFDQAQSDIQQVLPQFNAQALIGQPLDLFNSDALQQDFLQTLHSSHEDQIVLGCRTFKMIVSPVMEGQTRTGTVVEWTDMTKQLAQAAEAKAQAAQQAQIAAENARIKTGLDKVRANVMLADKDYNIVYMNETVKVMFSEAEAIIQQDLPHFDANALIGVNIDIFHQDPMHQRTILDQLMGTYEAELNIGGGIFQVVATAVREGSERVGTIVEWQDLTEKRAQEEAEVEQAERDRIIAEANLRVRQSLDNVLSNVMIADAENHIVYINNAVESMFSDAEADIRQDLPQFSAANLIGTNIDEFHKNPAHQQNILDNLESTYTTDLTVGGRTYRIIANPVMNEDFERIGTVAEWVDRTQEVAVESEVKHIVLAAQSGDLASRIGLLDKDGFFLEFSKGLNDLLTVIDSSFDDIATVVSAMARGDLTQKIEKDYQGKFNQVKQDLNATAEKLAQIITDVKDATDQISTTSQEISQGNNTLSERTESQASNLEETASSMEELTATVRNNADNAQQANQLSAGARNIAEKGGNIVGNAIDAMEAINKSSHKIADIISVIDGIAFQTNLLSLNASVEAARAGEHGRGFSVVATEVRNLAQRSAAAAKEIKGLIKDSLQKVKVGSDLVDDSGHALTEIIQSVDKVGDIISEISASSLEQSSGIDEVNRAITAIDEMTQQNAALAEQTCAASETSRNRADELEKLLSFFKASGIIEEF